MKASEDSVIVSLGVFFSNELARRYGVYVLPKDAIRIFKKRLRKVIDDAINGKATIIGEVSVRVVCHDTENVTLKEMPRFVMSSYQSSKMYAVNISLKDRFKGYYTFFPSRRILQKLKEKVDESPERTIKLTHNTTRIK